MTALHRFRKRSGDGASGRDPDEPKAARSKAKVICGAALPLLVAVYALLVWWSAPHTPGHAVRLDEFYDLLDRQAIRDANVGISDGRITGRFEPAPGRSARYWVSYGRSELVLASILPKLAESNIPTTIRQQPLRNLAEPASILFPALIIVDGMFLLFLIFGRGGEGYLAYGKAGGKRAGEGKITFKDVAGLDEAIEELGEVRDYLVNPERFVALGAAVPKGILLTGEPGCGKTLLARALAGEADVAFFTISGAEFVEVFVGVGASRIRDFFKVAKANVPCIVFIDELDAVGRSRTVAAMGGADEREATLNQLLVEMDGFDSGTGVVVMAATNRPDILDAALLRPGRFDRRLAIDRPDVRGREGILRIHTRGKPLAGDADIAALARSTTSFTGADLANVVNEAALLAARRECTAIEQRHLAEAVERVVAGPERRSRLLSPADRHRLAFHEAGHAVASAGAPGAHPVRKLSIVARNHAGGFTWLEPEGDQAVVTRSELLARITGTLGGRAAEELVTGERSSGATADLQSAGALARRMVTEFGMSDRLGPFSVGPEGLDHSEATAAEIDSEVRAVLNEADRRAVAILRSNRAALDALAFALMEAETLDGDLLTALLQPVRPVLEPLGR